MFKSSERVHSRTIVFVSMKRDVFVTLITCRHSSIPLDSLSGAVAFSNGNPAAMPCVNEICMSVSMSSADYPLRRRSQYCGGGVLMKRARI